MRGLEYLSVEVLGSLWDELGHFGRRRGWKTSRGAGGLAGSGQSGLAFAGARDISLGGKQTRPRAAVRLPGDIHASSVGSGAAAASAAGRGAEAVCRGEGSSQARFAARAGARRRQSERLVRELLETKALFAPQAWSIRQAHRFLTEAPRIEEAGVVVRVPDWWSARRPPRPQVQVRIRAAGECRRGR